MKRLSALGLRQDETVAGVQKAVQRLALHASEVDKTFSELREKLASPAVPPWAEPLAQQLSVRIDEQLKEHHELFDEQRAELQIMLLA